MISFATGILPYFAIVVFVVGIVYRTLAWMKRPMPFKWALFPTPKGSAGSAGSVVLEAVSLRSVYSGDRSLWVGAWLFHAMLALIVVGHSRVFGDFPALWSSLGLTEAGVDQLAFVLGGTAGVVILAMIVYLLFRRVVISRIRSISSYADYGILLLLLAIAVTGDYMRLYTEISLDAVRAFFGSLAAFSPGAPPGEPAFLIHFLLVQALLIYFPFSKLMHTVEVFINGKIARTK